LNGRKHMRVLTNIIPLQYWRLFCLLLELVAIIDIHTTSAWHNMHLMPPLNCWETVIVALRQLNAILIAARHSCWGTQVRAEWSLPMRILVLNNWSIFVLNVSYILLRGKPSEYSMHILTAETVWLVPLLVIAFICRHYKIYL